MRRSHMIVLAIIALCLGALGATLAVLRASSTVPSSISPNTIDAEKKVPHLTNTCLAHALVARIEAVQTASDVSIPNPDVIFSARTLSTLGSSIRFASVTDFRSMPIASIPVEVGGTYQGHSSCDYTLSDHQGMAALAKTGELALLRAGLPLAPQAIASSTTSPQPPAAASQALPQSSPNAGLTRPAGEQEYLLTSAAFRPDLVYLLICVPDPTSRTVDRAGTHSYLRSECGISVLAPDGQVRYAGLLRP